MTRSALARLFVVGAVLLAGNAPALPLAAAPGARCFAETNQCIAGRFLAYWDANGGLARNGLPLTPERREVLEDGNEYTVQYFERVRMELHPENAAPYDVLLGQFGRAIFRESFWIESYKFAQATAPVPQQPGQTYFSETGHNVGPRFAAYWRANGGLAQFGYPLGEERDESLQVAPSQPSQTFRVQYFERARFEYHPENAGTAYEVLLGQFGRSLATLNSAEILVAPFGNLYRTNAQVREELGPPALNYADASGNATGPSIATQPGAFLAFEHGVMLYTGNGGPGGSIQILCGSADSGSAVINSRLGFGIEDYWTPDQPVGGGPGPRPGTYEPKRGFGKLWSGPTRDCLGYALSADETAYTQTIQGFSRGIAISVPDGASAYAIYKALYAPGDFYTTGGHYQRYALPK